MNAATPGLDYTLPAIIMPAFGVRRAVVYMHRERTSLVTAVQEKYRAKRRTATIRNGRNISLIKLTLKLKKKE